MKIQQTKEGLILDVFVKPKSREFRITDEEGETVVYCTAEPVEGKVNKELVKGFSRLIHSKVELVSGFSSRQKRLLIRSAEKSEIETILSEK